jgi:hypothetical protein
MSYDDSLIVELMAGGTGGTRENQRNKYVTRGL